MKNKVLIIFTITSLFFVSHIYSFQFGVGTRGFVKKVIEKGQEEGKIAKTKEEKEKGKPNTINYINYTGKLDKLDLSQAKYLFLAPKSTSTTSHSPSIKGAIYKADMTQTEKTIFKMIEENGEMKIKEVNIYDEQGNRFDVNVYYIVKLSTEFISVALEIKGVWIVTTTTQVVNGSTEVVTAEQYFPISQWQTSVSTMGWGMDYSQYQKQYLVRLKDGAVFEGRYLPNDGNKKIYQDMYGNYYYIATRSNSVWWLNYYSYPGSEIGIQEGSLLKLNTKDMSVQVVSAQGDIISQAPEYTNDPHFVVDKYGNIAYLSMGTSTGYKYRKTTATVEGSNIEHKGFYTYPYDGYSYLTPIVDINRDAIYFIDRVGELLVSDLLRVRKVRCNADTLYEIEESSSTGSVSLEVLQSLFYSEILNIGDKEISLLETTYGKIIFPTIDLVKATTSYYYEVNYSTFGIDYNNFGSGFLGYQMVSSTEVYVLIKTQGQQSGRYRYTFYAIYPKEERIEKVFYTEKYEPSQGWPLFSVDENGNIIITATDLDTGTKNVLKITPNPDDPGSHNNISILQQGNMEVYYLVRVY
jgi:hypothetical protein